MDVHIHLLLGNGDIEQGKGIAPHHHAGVIGLLNGRKETNRTDVSTVDEDGLHGPVGPGYLLISNEALNAHIAVVQEHRQQPICDLGAVYTEDGVLQLAVPIGFIDAFAVAQKAKSDIRAAEDGTGHEIADIPRFRPSRAHEFEPGRDLGKEVVHLYGGPKHAGAGFV